MVWLLEQSKMFSVRSFRRSVEIIDGNRSAAESLVRSLFDWFHVSRMFRWFVFGILRAPILLSSTFEMDRLTLLLFCMVMVIRYLVEIF